jgi:hypothetical protein
MMSRRTPWSGPQHLKNTTGFGVIRIQVASKSTRAPLAGSDRYRGTGTAVPVPLLYICNDRQPSPWVFCLGWLLLKNPMKIMFQKEWQAGPAYRQQIRYA